MKKLYTLILLALFGFQANAQNFSYDVSQTLHTDLATNTYANAEIKLITNPATGITFQWELINNTIPTGWTFSLCDYTSCYSGTPANGTMTTITTNEAQNGTMGLFKFTINPFEVSGSAEVKFYVHDINDQNLGDTVTFTFNHVSTAGVGNNKLADLEIYPNPATEQVTFSNITSEINQIQIYNIVGELVDIIEPTKSTLTFSLSDYKPGAYFVSYVNNEGVRRTEKLVVR